MIVELSTQTYIFFKNGRKISRNFAATNFRFYQFFINIIKFN